MDAAYITPFITSVKTVFSMMLQMEVTVEKPVLKTEPSATYDVSGIIGMSGDVVGAVVLSFPMASAEKIVALFSGQELKQGDPDFADAIGELVNMVSGSAKGMFAGDRNISISCPSVVVGENHTLAGQKDTPCVVIPCKTDCGDMAVEVAIKEASASDTGSASTQAVA